MPTLPAPLLRALSLLPMLPMLPMLTVLVVAAAAGPPEARGQWVWPLDPTPVVVARFDAPADPWGAGHRGVDLVASVGQPVRAPEGGTVSFSGMVAGRPVVVVTHPDGLRSTLEPVRSTSAVGTSVSADAVVGTIAAGPGHCSPATCLHWGVLRDETYLDPLSFMTPRRVILIPLSAASTARGPSPSPPARRPPPAGPRRPVASSGAGRPG